MTPIPFVRLEQLLLPQPLPALVAVLVVAGVAYCGEWIARRLKGAAANSVDLAAGFMLATALLGGIVHAIAWAGFANVQTLRLLGWGIASAGVVQIPRWGLRHRSRYIKGLHENFQLVSPIGRLALVVGVLTGAGLILAALGPATDADSLDYHLGVPLDWLRHGGAYPRTDWFHARLVGLGEALNTLGLAAGTDCLGAAFQAAGLIIATMIVSACASTPMDRVLAALLVLGCPVMGFLVPNQKPQLLPSAATTLALVILVNRWKTLASQDILLAFGAIAFAIGCKYSFLISGSVVLTAGFIAARKAGRTSMALLVATLCFAVLVMPIYIRNFSFYGDPLSPLLERWKPHADPAVVGFATYLRDGGEDLTLAKFFRLPWNLAATTHLGDVSAPLGIGVLGFLFAIGNRGPARTALVCAFAATILLLALCQLTPRFFLEPYLWCAVATVSGGRHVLKALFLKVLTVQASLTAVMAGVTGLTLVPGALTRGARDSVMTKSAHEYAESKWLNGTLPHEAIVLTPIRSHALLPRPFFVDDFVGSGLTPVMEMRRFFEFVQVKQVTAIVTRYPTTDPNYLALATKCGLPLGPPTSFREAARNPFNRGTVYELVAIKLNLNTSDCQSTLRWTLGSH